MNPMTPILEGNRMDPLESDMMPATPDSADAPHRIVAAACGKARPNAGFDFGSILDLIIKLMGLVGGCPFARAKQSIKAGDTPFLAGAMKIATESGQFSPAESVRFAIALRDEAKSATDEEIDSFLLASPAFGRRV